MSAGALPQTPLGSLQCQPSPPDPLAGFGDGEGKRADEEQGRKEERKEERKEKGKSLRGTERGGRIMIRLPLVKILDPPLAIAEILVTN